MSKVEQGITSDVPSVIGDISSSLAVNSGNTFYDPDRAEKDSVKIESLIAGLDPMLSDPESLDYRFGAVHTLWSVINEQEIHTPSMGQRQLISSDPEIIRYIGENPGSTARDIMRKFSKMGPLAAVRKVNLLKKEGIIEPAVSKNKPDHAWQLTSEGINSFALFEADELKQFLKNQISAQCQNLSGETGKDSGRE